MLTEQCINLSYKLNVLMFNVALAYNNLPSFAECGRKIIFYQWLGGLKVNYKFKFFSKLPVFKGKRIAMCVYMSV